MPPKQQERDKLRERELLEAVERQNNYEKQEQKHLELIAKHEHNLPQQRAMLESVRTQLVEVRETVWRAEGFGVAIKGAAELCARRCATTDAWWFRRQKTVKVPQLQYI